MRTVVINDDYLGDSDVDYSVTRAKGIIINNENVYLIDFNRFS